jgi:hypothetical protein
VEVGWRIDATDPYPYPLSTAVYRNNERDSLKRLTFLLYVCKLDLYFLLVCCFVFTVEVLSIDVEIYDFKLYNLYPGLRLFSPSVRANKRLGADQALRHRYFSDLPVRVHELGDDEHIYIVPGVRFLQEDRRYSVLKAAADLRNRSR